MTSDVFQEQSTPRQVEWWKPREGARVLLDCKLGMRTPIIGDGDGCLAGQSRTQYGNGRRERWTPVAVVRTW